MPIGLVSVAKHAVNSMFSWTRQELHSALVSGDELYSSLRDLHIFSHPTNLLSVPDLPQQLVLDEQLFRFSFGDTLWGEVGFTQGEHIDTGVFIALRDGLERIFRRYHTCLLTMCGNTTAIMCDNGQFAVVDSHSRGANGLLHPDGTSVVLQFVCLDDLHHYIYRLADRLSSGEKPFELFGIGVEVGASTVLSGESAENCIAEAIAPPAVDLSEARDSVEVCAGKFVSEGPFGLGVSLAQTSISMQTFDREISCSLTAEPTMKDGKNPGICSGPAVCKRFRCARAKLRHRVCKPSSR